MNILSCSIILFAFDYTTPPVVFHTAKNWISGEIQKWKVFLQPSGLFCYILCDLLVVWCYTYLCLYNVSNNAAHPHSVHPWEKVRQWKIDVVKEKESGRKMNEFFFLWNRTKKAVHFCCPSFNLTCIIHFLVKLGFSFFISLMIVDVLTRSNC